MAKQTTCDRCGRDVTGDEYYHVYLHENHDKPGVTTAADTTTETDLCRPCQAELAIWLQRGPAHAPMV